MIPIIIAIVAAFLPFSSAHIALWTPAMWGFNVTQQTFPYDNRPVAPLINYTFEQWWFHGHLQYPPHPEDVFQLPAGQNVTTELGCNKGATSFFASSEGGDIRSGDDPCPGSPTAEYHTTGIDDVKGCALAIAYKSNVSDVTPEDFTVFSVNQTCVFNRFTDFSVPERMPPCPNGQCICAWFWIHSPDSGGEQNYMNGFQCNITNSTSTVPLAKSQVPRRCGADPSFNKALPAPGNCTYGAKQPFYWFQNETNNMFEGTYAPPFYTDLYNFLDGPQDDIFADSYVSLPAPNANQTLLPQLNVVRPGQALRVPNQSLLPASLLPTAAAGISTFVPSSSVASVVAASAPPSSPAVVTASSSLATTSASLSSAASSIAPSPSSAPQVTETVFVTVVVATPASATSTSIAVSTSAPVAPASNSAPVLAPAQSPASASVPAPTPSIIILNPASTNASTPTNEMISALAANAGQLLDAVNDTSADPSAAPVRMCRSNVKTLDSVGPDGRPMKRSLSARLGMGTYERKRNMHKRGLSGLWGFW